MEHLETPSTDSRELDCRVSPPSELEGGVGNGRWFSLVMLPGFFSHSHFLCSSSMTCLGHQGSRSTFLGPAPYFQMILEGPASCSVEVMQSC